ncbi:MAG: carboxypeptidase-like regulatory domain-containing protein [Terracidiphilus sp.]|nr:carboxypeptidase-like regulatory domain-containing protein [Terracidiphilus sp.]
MTDKARQVTQAPPMWGVVLEWMAAFVLLLFFTTASFAQSGAGAIQGTVSDQTGAVIPGATVHVVNQGTNVAAVAKTNNVGFYQVPNLFTGQYIVTVTAPGMKTFKTSIELLVAQNAMINAQLVTGEVTQEVEVSASTVQLTTNDNGTISSTLENARINQLPMNGRSILSLAAQSTPGLGSCNQDANGQCANGLMGYGMEYVADGVTLTGREFGGGHVGQAQFPDPDAIEEVRVQTVGTSAQYATPATGVITTKSGTNKFHGSLFETARNGWWGVANNRQHSASQHYIRNEFGASIGGPIRIPWFYNGKDKSFFFFAYERYSLASVTGETTTVPSDLWRNGDFSTMQNSSGVLQTLYDPNTTQYDNVNKTWTRQTFTQEFNEGTSSGPSNCNGHINCIPLNRESPTAAMVNAISPEPSSQYASVNPLVQTNLNADNPTELRAPTFTFRLDHQFSEKNRAYLRYTETPEVQTVLRNQPSNQPATIAATVNGVHFPANASGLTAYQYNMMNAAVGFTHVFSPTFYSETIASQQWFGEYNNAGGSPMTNYEQQMGLPNNFGEPGFPYFENIVFPVNGTQWIYSVTQIIDNLDENLVKTIGKHQLQFGGRYRHERFGSRPDEAQDNIQFNGYGTALLNPSTIKSNAYSSTSNTGQLNADFFLGAAQIYSINKQASYQHLHDMEFDGYIQDNFHAARNLTVNIGLRYEAHPAIWEKYGLMTSFDLKNDAMVLGAPIATLIAEGFTTQAAINNDIYDGAKFETAQQAGLPDKLMNDDNSVFEPRVGVAWQPFGKWGTVVRGAFGLYAFPVPFRSSVKNVAGNNPFQINYQTSYTSASQAPDGLPSYLLRSQQSTAATLPSPSGSVGYTPVMGVNTTGVVNSNQSTSILPGFNNFAINPNYPVDMASNANFTIEQPLKWNSALRVSYVYSHGGKLDQYLYYNNHPSTFVWEMQNGKATPNGGASVIGTSAANTYSSTATGPYDQTTWGGSNAISQKSGWSNDNQLQVSFQKLYHRGLAWQVMYDWQKNLRVGGNWNRDNQVYPYTSYANSGLSTYTYAPITTNGVTTLDQSSGTPIAPALPPSPPSGTANWAYYKALNRFENYGSVDTATPKQQLQYNYIVDLPFGRGKRFFGNVNKFLDELIGGYQIAGDGNLYSSAFTITATNWGPTHQIQYYKHDKPLTDCSSGTCQKVYMWWNGYVAPTANAANSCSAQASGKTITGLPGDYANSTAYQTPMDIVCGTTAATNDTYYGQNTVGILFPGSTTPASITYQPSPNASSSGWAGANPFSKTVLNGPFNIVNDASLFKVFPITERVKVRFNMDVFNVFNNQGSVGPSGSSGIQNLNTSSNNSARMLQFTLRLNY